MADGTSDQGYRIIAFDGGGIRGYLSALVYQKLDAELYRNGKDGDSLYSHADLFAGTSTGSFIAIASACGIPMKTMEELYTEQGSNIFKKASATSKCVPWILRGLGWLFPNEIRDIFEAKYGSKALAEQLEDHFGQKKTFGDLSQGDKNVVVNTLRLWSDKKQRWSSTVMGSAEKDDFATMRLVDAALCSGAAPTYFPPHLPGDGLWGYFADGGLFANNPSSSAISYAVSHFDKKLHNMRIISIGTGRTKAGIERIDIRNPQCWGGLKWLSPEKRGKHIPAAPLLEGALSASAEVCGDYANLMLGERYIRINIPLENAYPLDDYRNLDKLRTAVDDYTKTAEWNDLVDRARKFWVDSTIVKNPNWH